MRIFACAALAAAFAAPAAAGDFAGVWQGTVGAQPVRVCFNEPEWGTFGAYYYLSHLQAIALQQPDGQARAFVEGDDEHDRKSPRWSFAKAAPDTLSGNWTQSGRSLPIQLTRVPGVKLGEEETPCGSMAFQQPRLDRVRTVTRAGNTDGVAYTRLILDHRGHFGDDVSAETFALVGASPAIRKINAKLRAPLTGGDDGWLDCVRTAANSSPMGAESNETYEPRLFSRRWLVVMHQWDGFCGGAHPDSSSTSMIFDLTTGAEVDAFDWFTDKAVKREPVEGYPPLVSLRPAFRSLVLGRWKAKQAECDGALRTADYWHAEPTRTGFTFTPDLPHVVQACSEDFKVPFAKLQPWLSGAGKSAIAMLAK